MVKIKEKQIRSMKRGDPVYLETIQAMCRIFSKIKVKDFEPFQADNMLRQLVEKIQEYKKLKK